MNKCWSCGIDTNNIWAEKIFNLFFCSSCFYVFNQETFSVSLLITKESNAKWILNCKQEYFELQELG